MRTNYAYTTTTYTTTAYTTTTYTTTAYATLITTTLWISPLTAYFVPVVVALGLFLNTPLILTVSTLLYVFTASIGGRRGRRRSRPNSLCSRLRNSLRNSLRSSLYATAPVVTSCANPSSLVGLKPARSALQIRKLYAKSLSRYNYIAYRISTGLCYKS